MMPGYKNTEEVVQLLTVKDVAESSASRLPRCGGSYAG
jgi:hypothetical protein